MMLIFLLIGLLLGAVAVIFALQNITTITVVFLAWQIQGSLALILILAVLAGVLMSLLISIPEVIKKSFQVSGLKKQNNKLREELERQKMTAPSPAVSAATGSTTEVSPESHI